MVVKVGNALIYIVSRKNAYQLTCRSLFCDIVLRDQWPPDVHLFIDMILHFSPFHSWFSSSCILLPCLRIGLVVTSPGPSVSCLYSAPLDTPCLALSPCVKTTSVHYTSLSSLLLTPHSTLSHPCHIGYSMTCMYSVLSPSHLVRSHASSFAH